MDSRNRLAAQVCGRGAADAGAATEKHAPAGEGIQARVGLVIGQLTTGGAEGQLVELARRASRLGYFPIVYCLSEKVEPFGRSLEDAKVPLRVIGDRGAKRLHRLVRALQADRVDLLHAWLFIANTYTWVAATVLRLPFVATARNCKLQGHVHTLANRLAYQAAARIIANSCEVARFIERHYGAPAARICVVYNGVDTTRFRPLPTREARAPVVIGAGRLVPQKDPLAFVGVAHEIACRVQAARFVFAGDGPLRQAVLQEVRARGLGSKFLLPGECRDMPALLGGASLFLQTSAWEGFPNAVLEAMACGVPVIATDAGGTCELIRAGRDGFLVRHGDIEAMVHYAVELLRDEERRREFAFRARERAELFRLEAMVRNTCAVYGEVLCGTAQAAQRPYGRSE